MKSVNQPVQWRGLWLRLLSPRHLPTLLRKVRARMRGDAGQAKGLAWARAQAVDLNTAMQQVDGALWRESNAVAETIKQHARTALAGIPLNLGGGGCYPLLYFVTRKLGPEVIVETGVAAGFSSWAFLLGLRANGAGRLFSSDFPYFRLTNPEQYIGLLVPQDLRDRWTLMIEGDRRNLPRIVAGVDQVDLIHYDSDKSYGERDWAMRTLKAKASPRSVIIMDDIQDDEYFRQQVATLTDWRVFEFEGKYVGVIGFNRLMGQA